MANGETILVTGASGFVGSAVARALAARGLARARLARPTSPRDQPRELPRRDRAKATCATRASIERALDGVRALSHVAADYRLWAPRPRGDRPQQSRGHARRDGGGAGGRRRAHRLHHQRRHPARRRRRRPADETAPLTEADAIGAYKHSKVVAERLVEQMVAEQRPARGDRQSRRRRSARATSSRRRPAASSSRRRRGKMPGLRRHRPQPRPRRRRGARAICWRSTKGGSASATSSAAQDVSLQRDAGRDRRASSAASRRPSRLPRAPLYPLAVASPRRWRRITGKEPLLTARCADDGETPHVLHLGQGRARARLSRRGRSSEALADALAWFREAG